jgi:hypothetical protein
VEEGGQMIDPITAFAAAQAAIKGVKAAIALGKDIQAVSGDLMKFFEAKDVVQKAASKPKSTFAQSDTAAAFEIVMQAKQLADAERELNNYFVMSGNADLWQQLLVERNNIIQQRKTQEILDEKNAKAKAEEMEDFLTWLMAGALIILLLAMCFWWATLLLGK